MRTKMASNQRRQGLYSGCPSWTGWNRSWNLGCQTPSAGTAWSPPCSRRWTSRSCLAGYHWLDRRQLGYQEPTPPEERWVIKKLSGFGFTICACTFCNLILISSRAILSSILYLTHLGSPGCWMPNTSRSSLNHAEHLNFIVVLTESGVHQLSYIATLKCLCQQWPSLQKNMMSRNVWFCFFFIKKVNLP